MSDDPTSRSDRADGEQPYPSAEFAHVVTAVRDLKHPKQIGPYHILEPIGEGGMGSVYRAEQRQPIHRIVAIKVIKLGMDTRQVIARFESERQALALMNHPNVARVIDAGATETGRPYFVMEYVSGEPITSFADRRKLTVRQRLELFTQACDAVQHAHQKAIIHRDLKPSNILVTLENDRPWVKVIDFGLAKAVSQRLTEQTLFTETGQLVGTPEYMAPEQADKSAAVDVDTRSDVYSLGVVLYELLAGSLPFDPTSLRSAGYQEVLRIICNVDPPRPSTRLSSLGAGAQEVARLRQTPLEALRRQLKAELEWIPLKAMRKAREQRYASPAELSDDIANYLSERPLRAGPESATYRAQKFLRRNKPAVVAAGAMILLLMAGILATSWQAIRATRAEARATEERDNARATLEFLTDSVLSGARPENIPDVKVRDQIINAMITPAARRVAEEFKDRPLIEASVRSAIRGVLKEIGRSDLALPHAEAALALRRRVLGEDHPDTLSALNNYATVVQSLGHSPEAEPLHREALERYRRVLGADHPDAIMALNNYAYVLDALGRSAEAEPLYKEALERRRRVLGEDHPNTITSLNNYATVMRSLGRFEEAEPLSKEALERCRRVLGADHPNSMKSLSVYASTLVKLRRSAAAEPLYKEILERRRHVLGSDHPSTIQALSDIAALLQSQGRTVEAEPRSKEALESYRRTLGEDHPNTITALNNYAHVLWSLGRSDESERLFKESLERSRRALGDDHPDTIQSMSSYAYVELSQGRAAEAEPLARQAVALAIANPSLGREHSVTKSFAATHARALDALGRHAEAQALRKDFGLTTPDTQ
ncbi:MAG: tetratricopeptide repeat protein, partial [Tepidisphaeraceae bacterium]